MLMVRSMGKSMKVAIVWKKGAFRALRTAPEVAAELDKRANRIADAAGIGYRANPAVSTGGKGRARASVQTTTVKAIRSNAKHHTIMSALSAGKGDA